MHRIYQATQRILAARILAVELLAAPAVEGAQDYNLAANGDALAVKVDTGETFNVPTSWATASNLQVGGFLGLMGDHGNGQAVYISADRFAVDFAYAGDAPMLKPKTAEADLAPAPQASYTFEQFVAYGIANGGNVAGDMPWSFTFHGRAVSHESNDCYLITTKKGKTLNFCRGEVITVGEDDVITITHAAAEQAAGDPA